MISNINKVMFVTLLLFNLSGLTFTQPISCSEHKMPYTPNRMTKSDGHKIVELEYTMDLLQRSIEDVNGYSFIIAAYNVSDDSTIFHLTIRIDRTMEVLDDMVVVGQSETYFGKCKSYAVLNFKATSPRITIRIEEKRLALLEKDAQTTGRESFSASQNVIAILGWCTAGLLTMILMVLILRRCCEKELVPYQGSTGSLAEELTEIEEPTVNHQAPPTYPLYPGQQVERDVKEVERNEHQGSSGSLAEDLPELKEPAVNHQSPPT
ncbi:hypothetical protein Pmani_033621 [Petrolisthes manimaculis]|uniref:Uncharacterized protein n=1 Tax=Petrolisthes manimaculis TaxID=1843537 RepID=A0AAE1NQJ5_9EUCA|nr:hypothetical protein Pmani_033621 [Petrolisthes manimaculis]